MMKFCCQVVPPFLEGTAKNDEIGKLWLDNRPLSLTQKRVEAYPREGGFLYTLPLGGKTYPREGANEQPACLIYNSKGGGAPLCPKMFPYLFP